MVKIIAEAGVNHNGSLELAFELVDAAYASGADCVKFQTFKAGNLVTKEAQQAEYQTKNTGVKESQYSMLKRLELDYDSHQKLIAHCESLGIEFLSTAFDSDSLCFLVDILKFKTLKVPSGELTNAPFLLEHARAGCDLIVSTGMATLAEVEVALGVLAFGFTQPADAVPSKEAFIDAYKTESGRRALENKVTLLHCTTEYPAPVSEVNLKAMETMRAAFNLPIGYSDHTDGIHISIAATVLGATLIEKHFTLDKEMEGPDHAASLEPHELAALIGGIRDVENAFGNGVKIPQRSEDKNRMIARKSLVAATAIKKGELFTLSNITTKRPGCGTEPIDLWEYIGKAATCDYDEDQPI